MTKNEMNKRVFGEDTFIGTEQDKRKADRFNAIVTIAKAVCREVNGFTGLIIDDVNDNSHRNCVVSADLETVGFSQNKSVIESICTMMSHSDMVGYSTLGGKLRISFSVYDVWSDGIPFDRPGFVSAEELEAIDDMADELSDEEIESLKDM